MNNKDNFFWSHLWPIILAFAIALNEVLNADASAWWLVIAPAGGWAVWRVGAVCTTWAGGDGG